MAKTMQQRVRFRVPPEKLFQTYMDSRRHSAATGAPASVSRKVGGRFSAFNGALRGKTLAIVPKRLIVQAWRSGWKKSELDSILILTFRKARGGGEIGLVHANIPDHAYRGIKKGWNAYYWQPWRRYFARKGRRR